MDVLLIAAATVLVVWLAIVLALYLSGRTALARETARFVPNLIVLFAALARDPRVPRGAKAALLVAGVWLASPIDLIPEFLPVIGPLDDAIVAALVLRYVVRSAGRDVVVGHWRGDPRVIEGLLRLARI